jgi:FAD/FMN-containing dehydrogenase
MLEQTATGQLRTMLRGELIERGDSAYEQARKVYNGMIDRQPAAIARCSDVADVIAAVKFARDTGLKVSIRSGGHNAAGLGVCDDGLVIDLSRIRYTHVDRRPRRCASGEVQRGDGIMLLTRSGWPCRQGSLRRQALAD